MLRIIYILINNNFVTLNKKKLSSENIITRTISFFTLSMELRYSTKYTFNSFLIQNAYIFFLLCRFSPTIQRTQS